MPVFSDDFARADGAPGSNWTVLSGAIAIAGGLLKATSTGNARCNAWTSAGPHDATMTIVGTAAADISQRVCVKGNSTFSGYYYGNLTGTSGNYSAQIVREGVPSQTLVTATVPISLPPTSTYRLTYNAGNLYFYVNGVLWAWGKDTTLDANTYTGCRLVVGATGISYFAIDSPADTTFAVSPSSVQTGGPPVQLQLQGTGTAWTPGTPGSPTFTVNVGSLYGQVVASATYATVWFIPPDESGTATVTDPSTGLTAPVQVTAYIGPGGPGVTLKLTDAGAALLNRSGAVRDDDYLATNLSNINPGSLGEDPLTLFQAVLELWIAEFRTDISPPTTNPFSSLLWKIINNKNEQSEYAWTPSYDTSLKEDTEALRISLEALRVADTLTLQSVIQTLQGSAFSTLTELRDGIGITGQVQYASLVDAINATRGVDLSSLSGLTAQLNALVTPSNHNLGTILDAINNIAPGGDGGFTAADRAAIAAGFAALGLAIAGVETTAAADLAEDTANTAALAGLIVSAAEGFAAILELLNVIQSLLGGTTTRYQAPVWPGHAHVQLGTAYPLETTVAIEGPMHGVNIVITATEPGTSFMQYDDVKSWRHIGGLTFYNDDGFCETYQALNFGRAMYVPKTMAVAQGVKLFKSHLPRGTVTPWTISP